MIYSITFYTYLHVLYHTYYVHIFYVDIEKVSKLHQASAQRVQQALNIDGCEQIGLQSVTLRLTMKDDGDDIKEEENTNLINKSTPKYNYFLIFDEYRHAFIWNRGLRTMLHMIKIKAPITTIAHCVSSIDRINNDEIYDKMKINDNECEKWINHIITKLEDVRIHIFRAHRFAQASCILVYIHPYSQILIICLF